MRLRHERMIEVIYLSPAQCRGRSHNKPRNGIPLPRVLLYRSKIVSRSAVAFPRNTPSTGRLHRSTARPTIRSRNHHPTTSIRPSCGFPARRQVRLISPLAMPVRTTMSAVNVQTGCESAGSSNGPGAWRVLFPGLIDDGFPGLFRVTGARISRTDRSLPEGGQGAGVSDGRRRVKPLRGSSASLRPFG